MGYDQPKPTRACSKVATQLPLPECSGGLSGGFRRTSGGFRRDSGGPLKELRRILRSRPSGKVSNVLRRLPEGSGGLPEVPEEEKNNSGSTVKELRRFTPEHIFATPECSGGSLN